MSVENVNASNHRVSVQIWKDLNNVENQLDNHHRNENGGEGLEHKLTTVYNMFVINMNGWRIRTEMIVILSDNVSSPIDQRVKWGGGVPLEIGPRTLHFFL